MLYDIEYMKRAVGSDRYFVDGDSFNSMLIDEDDCGCAVCDEAAYAATMGEGCFGESCMMRAQVDTELGTFRRVFDICEESSP